MDQEIRKRIAGLLRGTPEDCQKALKALEPHITDKDAIAILVSCLAHPKWIIRKQAADLLGKVGPSAMEELIEAMESSNEDRSFWAIRILGEMGDRAVPHLARAYNSAKDKDRRFNVVAALGSTGTQKAIVPLVEALKDESWSVRREASNQLLMMGRDTLPKLQKGCSSRDPNLKYWSIKTLARIMGSEALGPMGDIVRNPDSKARYYAVLALGEIHDPAAADLLIDALGDESWIVRKLAADQLLRQGKECVPKLVKAFENGSPDVRYWSIQLIGKILKGNAIGSLDKILKEGDENLRNYAILALGETRSEKAIPLLIHAFADPSWVVREQASDILASFGRKAVSHLEKAIQAESEDIRFWTIRVLSKMPEQGFRVLADSLSWLDSKTRLFAIDTITDNLDSYPEEVMALLINCLADSHWPVRRKAYEGLVRMGAVVVPSILEQVASRDPDIRYWCGKVIDHFGRETAQCLLKTFARGNVDSCDNLLSFFQEVPSPALVQALLESPETRREEVRYYLIQLLSRVTGDALKTLRDAAARSGHTQALAIEALGQVEAPGVIRALTGMKAMDRKASLAMMKVMAEKKSAEAMEFLISQLSSADMEIRNLAVQLLGSTVGTGFLDHIPSLLDKGEMMASLILPQIVSSVLSSHIAEVAAWAASLPTREPDKALTIASILADSALQTNHEKTREFFRHIMTQWPLPMADRAIRSLREMEPSWLVEGITEMSNDPFLDLPEERWNDLADSIVHVLEGFSDTGALAEKIVVMGTIPQFLSKWCYDTANSINAIEGLTLSRVKNDVDPSDRIREIESALDELLNQPRHLFNSRLANLLRIKPGTIASLSEDYGMEKLSRAVVCLLRSGLERITEKELKEYLLSGKLRREK